MEDSKMSVELRYSEEILAKLISMCKQLYLQKVRANVTHLFLDGRHTLWFQCCSSELTREEVEKIVNKLWND
jgi:hypothetical protein